MLTPVLCWGNNGVKTSVMLDKIEISPREEKDKLIQFCDSLRTWSFIEEEILEDDILQGVGITVEDCDLENVYTSLFEEFYNSSII